MQDAGDKAEINTQSRGDSFGYNPTDLNTNMRIHEVLVRNVKSNDGQSISEKAYET